MADFDFNKLPRSYKKYYSICYCDGIECAVSYDGQLFLFDFDDIAELLKQYPRGRIGYFFNDSKDRYIAEFIGMGYITVNPSFCYQNFKEILV